jgi:hypothetical protein
MLGPQQQVSLAAAASVLLEQSQDGVAMEELSLWSAYKSCAALSGKLALHITEHNFVGLVRPSYVEHSQSSWYGPTGPKHLLFAP